MISLKRIVEQQGNDGFYDLGRDFANFRRTIDGSSDQIKQRFEQVIGEKLNGKRVRARCSRGYKQYVKDYEFDITKVTLDDYYDNYVVVAHDNTTPKAKEYFLKPGFKIQVLGSASGQPSVGADKSSQNSASSPTTAPTTPEKSQAAPMMPVGTPNAPLKEEGAKHCDAYSKEAIAQDIKGWLPQILRKPDTILRDFIKELGWLKNLGKDGTVALFDLVLPAKELKVKPTSEVLNQLIQTANKNGVTFEIKSITPNESNTEAVVRVKKTKKDSPV